MLPATADLVVFADADMATPPDQLPLLVAALADPRRRARLAIQPDGSDMRTSQPAIAEPLVRVPRARLSVGGRPVQDTSAASRASVATWRTTCSGAADRQHRLDVELILPRSTGVAYDIAIVPVHCIEKNRRGSRMRPRSAWADRRLDLSASPSSIACPRVRRARPPAD